MNIVPCGNDTFIRSSGNFILLDDSHIRFILKIKSVSNYHIGEDLESELNKDLGVFYIYKGLDSVRLRCQMYYSYLKRNWIGFL